MLNGKQVLALPKDITKFKDAYEIYKRLDELDPYSVDDSLTAHGIMTRGLVEESGVFLRWHTPHPRSCPCCPGGGCGLCTRTRPAPAPSGRSRCCPCPLCRFWPSFWWCSSSPPARTASWRAALWISGTAPHSAGGGWTSPCSRGFSQCEIPPWYHLLSAV